MIEPITDHSDRDDGMIHEPSGDHSLLNLHQDQLRSEAAPSKQDSAETTMLSEFKSMELKPLDFAKPSSRQVARANTPSRQRGPFSLRNMSALAAVAALLALMVFTYGPYQTHDTLGQESYSIKGAVQVTFISEHEGITGIITATTPLEAGDRANASVLAPTRSIAFMTVFDSQNNSLMAADSIVNDSLNVQAGVETHFKNAVELDAHDQGEVMVVAVCNAEEFAKVFFEPRAFVINWLADIESDFSLQEAQEICTFKSVSLRPIRNIREPNSSGE